MSMRHNRQLEVPTMSDTTLPRRHGGYRASTAPKPSDSGKDIIHTNPKGKDIIPPKGAVGGSKADKDE